MNEPEFLATDFDGLFKRAIEAMHEHFMRMFFPRLSRRLIFPEKAPSKDKELEKIFPDWTKKGKTVGDKLLGYQSKVGKMELVLIHIEAHGADNASFKESQFIRFYRIRDQLPKARLTQLAIYMGETVPPDPAVYRYSFSGTRNTHRFNIYIVKDQDRNALIELSKTNPFALVILALLETIATKNDAERRRKTKLRLMRLCLDSPFKDLIKELFIFVEFSMYLPEKEEIIYREEFEELIQEPMKALVETNPNAGLSLQLVLFNGKTYQEHIEERDKERNVSEVLTMHHLGIEVEKIATIVKLDKRQVEQIIAEHGKEEFNGHVNGKRASTKKKKS